MKRKSGENGSNSASNQQLPVQRLSIWPQAILVLFLQTPFFQAFTASGAFYFSILASTRGQKREGCGALIKTERFKHQGTVVLTDDQEAGRRSVWFLLHDWRGTAAQPAWYLRGRGWWRAGGVCYREPSVYVSVNVMSSQDQGSRRAATMEGRGGLVHCWEGAGRSTDLQLCRRWWIFYPSPSWRITNNMKGMIPAGGGIGAPESESESEVQKEPKWLRVLNQSWFSNRYNPERDKVGIRWIVQ